MKKAVLLIVVAVVCTPLFAQTFDNWTKLEMKNDQSLNYYFVYLKMRNTVVVSMIQAGTKSYKDKRLNETIEKEIEKQWLEHLKRSFYEKFYKVVFEEEKGNVFFVQVEYGWNFKLKELQACKDKFRTERSSMIAKWQQEGFAVYEEKYFSYAPSSGVARQLANEREELDALEKRIWDKAREEAEKEELKRRINDMKIGLLGEERAAMATAMLANADNDDEDEKLASYLKGQFGFGLQNIPVIKNSTRQDAWGNSSETGTTNYLATYLALSTSFFNNKFVSLRLEPFFVYGPELSLVSGRDSKGAHLNYGGTAMLCLGRSLELQLRGSYAHRYGSSNTELNVTGTKAVETSTYKYYTVKYGPGLRYGFKGHDNFIEVAAYREDISFLRGATATVYSCEARLSLGFIAVGCQYGQNYPIAGELEFASTFKKNKQNFMAVFAYVPFTLSKKN